MKLISHRLLISLIMIIFSNSLTTTAFADSPGETYIEQNLTTTQDQSQKKHASKKTTKQINVTSNNQTPIITNAPVKHHIKTLTMVYNYNFTVINTVTINLKHNVNQQIQANLPLGYHFMTNFPKYYRQTNTVYYVYIMPD